MYMHGNWDLLEPRNAVLILHATIPPHYKVSVLPFIDVYITRLAGETYKDAS